MSVSVCADMGLFGQRQLDGRFLELRFIVCIHSLHKSEFTSLHIGPVSSETYKFACAPIEDSDQPAHLRGLIRVFDERSMGSQVYIVSSGRKP